jgi:hypothetical protein
MNTVTIMDTMSRPNESRDVSFLKDCNSCVELYRKVRTSELRYRATLDDYTGNYSIVNKINHSKVLKYENFI